MTPEAQAFATCFADFFWIAPIRGGPRRFGARAGEQENRGAGEQEKEGVGRFFWLVVDLGVMGAIICFGQVNIAGCWLARGSQNREDGANPSRTRRCNRRRNPDQATVARWEGPGNRTTRKSEDLPAAEDSNRLRGLSRTCKVCGRFFWRRASRNGL